VGPTFILPVAGTSHGFRRIALRSEAFEIFFFPSKKLVGRFSKSGRREKQKLSGRQVPCFEGDEMGKKCIAYHFASLSQAKR
jgi:hypothetical protein